jgi:hypothetical protein
VGEINALKGTLDRKPFALESAGGGRDGSDRPVLCDERRGSGHPREAENVIGSDGGHADPISSLLVTPYRVCIQTPETPGGPPAFLDRFGPAGDGRQAMSAAADTFSAGIDSSANKNNP